MYILVEKAAQGMYLAKPVFFGDTLLIPAGTKLTEWHLYQLKQWKIDEICISEVPLKKNGNLPQHDLNIINASQDKTSVLIKNLNQSNLNKSYLNNSKLEEIIKEELSIYCKFAIMKYYNVNYKKQKFNAVINKILLDVCAQQSLFDSLMDLKSIDIYTYRHSINVMVLSVLTGETYNLSPSELYKLGLGALFHDIGKIKISRNILFSEGVLSPEERLEMEKHSFLGYEYLSQISSFPKDSLMSVLEHHERTNGLGYPNKLSSDDITTFASILGICDTFEAMTAERLYRKGFTPLDALEFLMANGSILFSHETIKTFIQSISIFKVGSTIELSTKDSGIIIEVNPKCPGRPIVKILYNSNQEKLSSPYILDLSALEHSTKLITRVFT